jgi:hypothetical protein
MESAEARKEAQFQKQRRLPTYWFYLIEVSSPTSRLWIQELSYWTLNPMSSATTQMDHVPPSAVEIQDSKNSCLGLGEFRSRTPPRPLPLPEKLARLAIRFRSVRITAVKQQFPKQFRVGPRVHVPTPHRKSVDLVHDLTILAMHSQTQCLHYNHRLLNRVKDLAQLSAP